MEERRFFRRRFAESYQEEQEEYNPESVEGYNFNTSFLNILYSMLPKYRAMVSTVLEINFYTPSEMLTLNGITNIISKLEGDHQFYLECLNFIDTINYLEIMYYNHKPGEMLRAIYDSLASTRDNVIRNPYLEDKDKETARKRGSSALGDRLLQEDRRNIEDKSSESQSVMQYLNENKVLLGFYVFLLTYHFYSQEPTVN